MINQIIADPDDYMGAIKIDSEWQFFYEMLSMWILDYKAYDPEYVPKSGGWRENILKVDRDNAKEYCQAMKTKEIPVPLIPNTMSSWGRQLRLTFVVNFDERLFINGWHDNIAIHEYVPDGWKGIEDDPYSYIPQELKTLWGK
jgi:hypothetical protein